MALGATLYHLQIDLSDVDRSVYEALDLRVARHPSENMRFLLTRVLAYCLCFEEGIVFSKGLSATEEPALWIRDAQNNLRAWIEIGTPSAERLHKASKAAPRLVVFTQNDPAQLQKEASRGKAIHRAEEIEIYALEPTFLDALAALTERNAKWGLVHNGSELYVTVGSNSVTGTVTRHSLVA
jgi:uncharacterized protein YaeQ